jgi:hypothetical protein
MPIYEFYCPENNKIYQFFAKSRAQAESTPVCPDNPSYRMIKLVSGFSIGGVTRKSKRDDAPSTGEGGVDAGSGSAPEDPRMEAALAEMERGLESVDENDPRAMARMMRRMSEITGEKLDGQMEEVVRKLEEGADPESLEEEFGEAFGDGAEDGAGGSGGWRGRPTMDPHLYDY